jgi:hypothetical protein
VKCRSGENAPPEALNLSGSRVCELVGGLDDVHGCCGVCPSSAFWVPVVLEWFSRSRCVLEGSKNRPGQKM